MLDNLSALLSPGRAFFLFLFSHFFLFYGLFDHGQGHALYTIHMEVHPLAFKTLLCQRLERRLRRLGVKINPQLVQ